jgi:AraC-like DNA-binding protein
MELSLRSYDGCERVHAHGFHQIVLPVAGRLEMQVGVGGSGMLDGHVETGRGVLVAAAVEHGFRAAGDNRFLVLDLAEGDALLRACAPAPFFAIDDALGSLINYLAFDAGTDGLDPVMAHHALHLLRRALERRLQSLPTAVAPAAGTVAQAVEIMRNRFAEPLTVEEIARAVGLAPSRFHELFRRGMGISPGRHLAALRLDFAEQLLREGTQPIAEVALASGFSDQSALTRSLRRERGVTPAAFRRAHLR